MRMSRGVSQIGITGLSDVGSTFCVEGDAGWKSQSRSDECDPVGGRQRDIGDAERPKPFEMSLTTAVRRGEFETSGGQQNKEEKNPHVDANPSPHYS